MVRRRRRPLRRATMVGGTVYGAGPSTQRGREQALPAPAGGVSEAATDQLEQLQGAGVVTQDELDDQMRRLLQGP
jgi:hypothetical protein